MKNISVLKTLWFLRFEKMKKTEEEAAWGYQEIMDECLVAFGPESPIVRKLQQLVKEERMHERLAEELVSLCKDTHPEVGLL